MRTLHLILIVFITSLGWSQEKTLVTTPEEVTLYLQSAKVSEKGNASLTKGKNTITITNLSNYIDTNTYQIGLSNGATLLSVMPGANYLKEESFSEEEQKLIDQKEKLELNVRFKEAESVALNGELTLIEENRKIGNSNEGWTTTQLSELAAFYASRILEIRKNLIVVQDELSELRTQVRDLSKQLGETTATRNKNRQELVLEIEATQAMSSTVTITYIVTNAGWQPLYDIRASSLEAPLSIITKGRIYQNTGKDWNNVAMKVSTYRPKSNQNRPILNPFYVKAQPSFAPMEDELEEMVVMESVMTNSAQMRKEALSDVAITEVIEQQFNAVYALNTSQTVTSTGKGQTVILDTKEVPATYVHHTVPKLNEETFLLAKIKNWQSLNLLLTEANIYFEGDFIGKTTINPNYTKSEYPLSLGIDERVVVKYRLLDNLSTTKTLSSKKVETFAYEIKLRNNSRNSINLEVLDQLPISQNNKIEVKMIDLNEGSYDEGTGSVLWDIPLASGTGKTLTFSYEVKYPKDMVLQYY